MPWRQSAPKNSNHGCTRIDRIEGVAEGNGGNEENKNETAETRQDAEKMLPENFCTTAEKKDHMGPNHETADGRD